MFPVLLGVCSYPMSSFISHSSNNAEKSPRTVFFNVLLHTVPLSTTIILINNNKLYICYDYLDSLVQKDPHDMYVEMWNLGKFLQLLSSLNIVNKMC